jgi:Glycosyltransferase family 10 (fucosyltransferase) C-term/Fucosyltransferase, N-terminal
MREGKLLILIHNRFWDEWPAVPEQCPTPCVFTTDQAAADDADAILVHVPSLQTMANLKKRPKQLLVAWSMESRVMCTRLDNAAFMHQFDLTMTYERSSDVWDPYFGPGTVPTLRSPAGPRSAPSPVVYLQRNRHDQCGRYDYAAQLMEHVRVDSFGAVHRNQTTNIPSGWRPRHELYGRYKFTLAFENSIATDYVTEKFFEPLGAGSVPVYRGTSEVEEFAPGANCFVNADAFESPAQLGQYLEHLDHHPDEYQALHAWRTQELSPSFLRLVAQSDENKFARLAARVAERLGLTELRPGPA